MILLLQLVAILLGVPLLLGLGYWLRGILSVQSQIQIEGLTTERDNLVESLRHAVAQWDEWQGKAEGYRGAIEGILGEKKVWQDLYTEQVIAHGNAQTSMMDAIGYLQHKLIQAGIQVTLPPVIAQAREAFLERHVLPTLERTGTPVIHRGPPTPELSDLASAVKTLAPEE